MPLKRARRMQIAKNVCDNIQTIYISKAVHFYVSWYDIIAI